jgi:transposase
MPKHSVVPLSDDPRALLSALLPKGTAPARTVRRAPTLLLADERPLAQTIAAMLQTAAVTVTQTCQRFVATGLDAALDDRPRPGSRRKLDGRREAQLVALAWSTPPAGRERWSLRLFADRLVAWGLIETIASATVRRVRNNTGSNRGPRNSGASPRRAPSSWPGWKTCSIGPKHPMIRSGPASAVMSAPVNCGRIAGRPWRWSQGTCCALRTKLSGTAPVTSSAGPRRFRGGAMSWGPPRGPSASVPTVWPSWCTSIFPRRRSFAWSWIICAPTPRERATKSARRRKPAGSCGNARFVRPPGMGVGCLWQPWRWPCWRARVCIDGFPMPPPGRARWRPGKRDGIATRRRATGA